MISLIRVLIYEILSDVEISAVESDRLPEAIEGVELTPSMRSV